MEKQEAEVLVKATIDYGQSEANTKKMTAALSDLVGESKDLEEENKKLMADGKAMSTQYTDNTKKLQDNKNQIDQTAKSLDANKKAIQENTDTVEKNTSSTDKSKSSLIGMGTAIDKIVPGFDGASEAATGLNKTFDILSKNPWSIAIGILAGLLASLISYFKNTGDGADKLSFIMAGLGTAMKMVTDFASMVGRALFKAIEDPKQAWTDFKSFLENQIEVRFKSIMNLIPNIGKALNQLFSGDFADAAKTAADAFGGVVLGVENLTDKVSALGAAFMAETRAGVELAKMLDALEDRERNYNLQASRTTLEIQRLTLAAKNRNLSTEESTALLDRATELEKKRAAELTAIRTGQLKATLDEVAQRLNLEKKKGESLDDYAKRLINFSGKEGELTDENKDRIIAAVQAVDQARGESYNLLEKLQNKQDAIELKAQADKEKAEKAKADAVQKRIDQEQKWRDEDNKKYLDEVAQHNADMDAAAKKEFEDGKKQKQMIADAEMTILDKLTADKSAARAIGTALLKKDAIKEIVISTEDAAMKAFSALASIPIIGPVLGAVAAAAVIAYGAVRVANVVGVNFAQGGRVPRAGGGSWSTIGGRDHAVGGTKFYGEDGTAFEAQSDEGLFILKREAHADFIKEQSGRNQRFGGRAWSDSPVRHAALGGEIATFNADQKAISSRQIDNLINSILAMPAPRVLVDDIDDGLSRKATVSAKADLL